MSRATQTRGAAFATVLAVLALTFLDTTVVSVALGDIQHDLGAGIISLQWVANGYSLPFAALMLIAGSLADQYGRKRVMLVGISVFSAGAAIAALAPNVAVLIAGRAVMGVGAAASEPGTLSVIRHLFPDHAERARALGTWSAVSGLALALGPVLGGILLGLDGWRAVFWFSFALGAVLLAACAAWLPESADPRPGRLDGGGFALVAIGLGSLIYAGISGEQHGYGAWWVVALFVLAGLALAGWSVVERHVVNPMLALSYLKDRAVATSLLVAFAIYFGIFSIFFFTALYLDLAIGYTGWHLAAIFTPMAVTIVLGSLAAGSWVARRGPQAPMLIGCVLSAAGILLTRAIISPHVADGELSFALALAGVGFGIAVVPLTAAVLGHVRPSDSGMAASATNTARQLGAVIGVAVLGALVNAHLTGDFGSSLTTQGVPQSQREYILGLLVTGGSDAAGIDIANPPEVIRPLIEAAMAAFHNGLNVALVVSAVLILLGATAVALVPRAAMAPGSELD